MRQIKMKAVIAAATLTVAALGVHQFANAQQDQNPPQQGGGFGGGRGGAGGNPFDADFNALMAISKTTGGSFYRAQDADQLSRALAKLPAAFTIVRKHLDLASWFAVGGGLLVAAAVGLSLWWNRSRRGPVPAGS